MKTFSTDKCKEYVLKYKKDFDENKFLKKLAEKLLYLDYSLEDYDSTDIED
jgi:hypothetical protein